MQGHNVQTVLSIWLLCKQDSQQFVLLPNAHECTAHLPVPLLHPPDAVTAAGVSGAAAAAWGCPAALPFVTILRVACKSGIGCTKMPCSTAAADELFLLPLLTSLPSWWGAQYCWLVISCNSLVAAASSTGSDSAEGGATPRQHNWQSCTACGSQVDCCSCTGQANVLRNVMVTSACMHGVHLPVACHHC